MKVNQRQFSLYLFGVIKYFVDILHLQGIFLIYIKHFLFRVPCEMLHFCNARVSLFQISRNTKSEQTLISSHYSSIVHLTKILDKVIAIEKKESAPQ